MTIRNKYAHKIYHYIYCNDGQTILIKDIISETQISKPTVHKYLKWLERRNLIRRAGKRFYIIPEH